MRISYPRVRSWAITFKLLNYVSPSYPPMLTATFRLLHCWSSSGEEIYNFRVAIYSKGLLRFPGKKASNGLLYSKMRVGCEMSNWELSKKPASMQANTWEIFIIRLRQSCVLLHEICIVVLQVVLWNLKLVEILSKSTKAAKIKLLYRINCSVWKGFPALEAKIPYLPAPMYYSLFEIEYLLWVYSGYCFCCCCCCFLM